MKKVQYSLKAPIKLATRSSGNNKSQKYRSMFMRDRDRILYSKSFRRLAGKTQVYLSGNDDHKRTRLTHTLEVAQIAKTITQSLSLDLDLTEAIALGHDIGHTPFGHAGERMLHEIMTPTSSCEKINHSPFEDKKYNNSSFCGFKHNLQSVAVSIETERDYDSYGLDLTNFTLYGMYSHSSSTYKKGNDPDKLGYYQKYFKSMNLPNSNIPAWSFEAFVVAEADEIAQRHHDVEDAIRGNLISKDEVINKFCSIFNEYLQSAEDKKIIKQMKNTSDIELYISLLSRIVVNLFVTRITECSIYNLNEFISKNKLNSKSFPSYMLEHGPDDAKKLISYDYINQKNTFKEKMKSFEKYISENILWSYDIQTADSRGCYIIKKIFQAYYSTPTQLPDHCIIEYFMKTNKYSYNNIQEIIKTKGMGSIRVDFSTEIEKENLSTNKKLILCRVICNQIAGMTDTFAQKTYNNLYS